MICRPFISVLASFLVAVASILSSAMAALPDNCSYFTSLNKEDSGIKILEVLDELPDGFALEICSTPSGYDSVTVLSPVSNRDGVSFYKFAYYTMPPDLFVAEMTLAEFYQQDETLFGTMMALDEDANLAHLDQAFIEASYVSVGAYKRFYNFWAEVFKNPKKRSRYPDLSRLSAEDLKVYNDLVDAIGEHDAWKIHGLQLTPPDADFSPMYVVEVGAGGRPWSVYFDLIDDKITVLGVSEGVF